MSILGKGVLRAGADGSRIANMSRMGTLRTYAPTTHTTGASGVGVGFTLHTTWAVDGEFDLVRPFWLNRSASSFTLDAVRIAPSAQLGNGYSPTDSGGSAIAMTQLTFNDAGAVQGFPSASGAATSVTVPAPTDTYYPSCIAADWVQISSLPRVDSADGKPLVMVRAYSAQQGNWSAGTTADMINGGAWETQNRGRVIRAYQKGTGDFTNAFVAPVNGPNATFACSGLQFYSRAAGATVMPVGDSLNQGHIIDGGQFYTPAHFASAALTRVGRPVTFLNAARSGGNSLQFFSHARTMFDLFKPDVVVISVWTPNDTRTRAAADLCFARAMAFADYVRRAGAVPILSTAVPYALGAADDLLRRTNNDLARASGLPLSDYDAAVSDGAIPGRTLAEYLAPTGAHLNADGYAACGAVLAPVIDQVLA